MKYFQFVNEVQSRTSSEPVGGRGEKLENLLDPLVVGEKNARPDWVVPRTSQGRCSPDQATLLPVINPIKNC